MRGRSDRYLAGPTGCSLGGVFMLLSWLTAPALGEVDVRFELPAEVVGHTVYWALQQPENQTEKGSFIVENEARHVSLSASEGQASLLVAVNRDQYESHVASFGDLYQQVSFEVHNGNAAVVLLRAAWQERTLTAPDNLLTIHYHRFEEDYDGAGLWIWDEHRTRMPEQQETFAVGLDAFGAVFQLDTGLYGAATDRIGLLPRLHSDWRFKDDPDRYWAPALGREVYLLQGEEQVFPAAPDTSPQLVGAECESATVVLVRFTRRLPVVEFPRTRFTVRTLAGAEQEVMTVSAEDEKQSKANTLRLKLAKPLKVAKHAYEVVVAGFGTRRISLGGLLIAPQQFYDPNAQLGALYTPAATTFRVFAPMAETVEVVLAEAHVGDEPKTVHALTAEDHGLWSVTVPGDWEGSFYSYRLSGLELDPTREVTDIYATCTTGPGGRGLIVDLEKTNPPGFDPGGYVKLDSPVDAVIYEMHVRDFTITDNSGIRQKGKYLGWTETGTHLPDAPQIKTGLDHLVELGVTHVQLMPIQDFDNEEGPDSAYNWGYMPICFNSPEGWYASVPVGPQRITEFKQLVHALHQRGIGVIMDVVYNHAATGAGFEQLVPGYYFRRRPDGSFWNGSGCGNELASEHPMARKFMLDSLTYWVRAYSIDGFRFDLMGLHDLKTMKLIRDELRRINPSVLVYGEPWTGGASGLRRITDKGRVAGTGIAAFNDHFRDAIKGDRDGGAPGFIQTGDRVGDIRKGIQAALGDWAKQPTDCLTYCACHDNLTTWDKIQQAAQGVPVEMQQRMQRFAGLLVLTSQGISFLHGGQEFCRSKGGSHNSYNLPDEVNRIDWSLKQANHDVFAYYQGLIALRGAHPVFRLRTAAEIHRRLKFIKQVPAARCLAYTLDGAGLEGETHAVTLVLLNGEAGDQTFRLPPGKWQALADADRAGTEPIAEVEGEATVKAHSGMVLAR